VVRLDLEVMARISLNDDYFDQLMQSLIVLFRTDPQLLQNRGSLIIRQLSLFIHPEKIYRKFSIILETEAEPDFVGVMIQSLNLILLTSVECVDVRSHLKDLAKNASSRDLFTTLYRSWAHSPISLLSLCMLCQAYEHACQLLNKFADFEMTVNFLLEIDKLVQLLESPIFTYLRLQLLEPERYPYLFKSLYGLLMILPQSSAFETLRNRLTCISSLGVLQLIPKTPTDTAFNVIEGIDFNELLNHFQTIQDKHRKAQLEALNHIEIVNNTTLPFSKTTVLKKEPGLTSPPPTTRS